MKQLFFVSACLVCLAAFPTVLRAEVFDIDPIEYGDTAELEWFQTAGDGFNFIELDSSLVSPGGSTQSLSIEFELTETGFAQTVVSYLLLEVEPLDLSSMESFLVDIHGNSLFHPSHSLFFDFVESDGDVWRVTVPLSFMNEEKWNDFTVSIDSFALFTAAGDGVRTLDEVNQLNIIVQNISPAVPNIAQLWFDNFRWSDEALPETADITLDTIKVNRIDPEAAPVIGGDFDDSWFELGPSKSNFFDENGLIDDSYATEFTVLADGEFMYVGLLMNVPSTAAFTADTGEDTFTKWNVEDFEITFGNVPGVTIDYYKFTGDAFDQIDDMFPDSIEGTQEFNAPSLEYSSAIISETQWAAEFRVSFADMPDVDFTALVFGHVGLQYPADGVFFAWPARSSFQNQNGGYDFSILTSVEHWMIHE